VLPLIVTLPDKRRSLIVPEAMFEALSDTRAEPLRAGKAPVRFADDKLVSALPSSAGSLPVASSRTSWLIPLKVLPFVVTFVERRKSFTVPLDMLDALSVVNADPFRAGSAPVPSSNTSWLLPLNVLPFVVTLVDKRRSFSVPLLIFAALSDVSADPFRAGSAPDKLADDKLVSALPSKAGNAPVRLADVRFVSKLPLRVGSLPVASRSTN